MLTTMNQAHRTVLKRNRVDIIEGIANPIDVSEALYINGIFTESIKQEVEVGLKCSTGVVGICVEESSNTQIISAYFCF